MKGGSFAILKYSKSNIKTFVKYVVINYAIFKTFPPINYRLIGLTLSNKSKLFELVSAAVEDKKPTTNLRSLIILQKTKQKTKAKLHLLSRISMAILCIFCCT